MTKSESAPSSSAWPSGALRATSSAAMLPFDPTRYSVTTGCPSAPASFSPITRATMSGAPPGAVLVTMRIGRDGYCEEAAWTKASATEASAAAARRVRLKSTPRLARLLHSARHRAVIAACDPHVDHRDCAATHRVDRLPQHADELARV